MDDRNEHAGGIQIHARSLPYLIGLLSIWHLHVHIRSTYSSGSDNESCRSEADEKRENLDDFVAGGGERGWTRTDFPNRTRYRRELQSGRTDVNFAGVVKNGGFGKFRHGRELAPPVQGALSGPTATRCIRSRWSTSMLDP